MAREATILVPETEEDKEISLKVDSLNEQIRNKYSDEWYRALVQISYEVSDVGLPLREACIINDIDFEQMLSIMNKDPLVKRLFEKKDLQYKRSLLKVVSNKATHDDKIALDLLMARYPNEFNKRKGSSTGEDAGGNLVNMAINFIQNNGDAQPLVGANAGRAIVINEDSTQEEPRKNIMDRLAKLLN